MSINADLGSIVQGDTENIIITFPVSTDLSDYSFFFTAKEKSTDEDVDAVISKAPSDFNVVDNVVTLPLSATDTDIAIGTYLYDLQYTTVSGEVTTFAIGKIKISRQITIRVS